MSPEQVKHHQRLSNLAVVAALLASFVPPLLPVPTAVVWVGGGLSVPLFVFGCAHYALSKGHDWLWGFAGLGHMFGLFMLAALPNRVKILRERRAAGSQSVSQITSQNS